MEDARYTLRVLEAYEDEVAGAAYFEGLSSIYPDQAAFLGKCAALERQTAASLSALIRKYQLAPRARSVLEQRGAPEARREAGSGWQQWRERSIDSYARYVDDFKALETIGPASDQPVLAALTAHEVQLIEWLRAQSLA
jgi:hypothetical protein